MATQALPAPMVFAMPKCPRCGSQMSLVHIFPHGQGQDQRTYECLRCEYEISEIVKFNSAA